MYIYNLTERMIVWEYSCPPCIYKAEQNLWGILCFLFVSNRKNLNEKRKHFVQLFMVVPICSNLILLLSNRTSRTPGHRLNTSCLAFLNWNGGFANSLLTITASTFAISSFVPVYPHRNKEMLPPFRSKKLTVEK